MNEDQTGYKMISFHMSGLFFFTKSHQSFNQLLKTPPFPSLLWKMLAIKSYSFIFRHFSQLFWIEKFRVCFDWFLFWEWIHRRTQQSSYYMVQSLGNMLIKRALSFDTASQVSARHYFLVKNNPQANFKDYTTDVDEISTNSFFLLNVLSIFIFVSVSEFLNCQKHLIFHVKNDRYFVTNWVSRYRLRVLIEDHAFDSQSSHNDDLPHAPLWTIMWTKLYSPKFLKAWILFSVCIIWNKHLIRSIY